MAEIWLDDDNDLIRSCGALAKALGNAGSIIPHRLPFYNIKLENELVAVALTK